MRDMFRPGMRAYLVPLVAGPILAVSPFLPWVRVGEVVLTGVPETTGLWVVGLGVAATALALASLITRRNSRHPLLLVGLLALGLMFLSWRLMPQAVSEQVLTRSQALAIVDGTSSPASAPPALTGVGIYAGLASATVIVGFGLTIVVRPASRPYVVVSPDDDV